MYNIYPINSQYINIEKKKRVPVEKKAGSRRRVNKKSNPDKKLKKIKIKKPIGLNNMTDEDWKNRALSNSLDKIKSD